MEIILAGLAYFTLTDNAKERWGRLWLSHCAEMPLLYEYLDGKILKYYDVFGIALNLRATFSTFVKNLAGLRLLKIITHYG